MDWYDFIISQALFVVDQILKDPVKRKKYKARLLKVATLINSMYPPEVAEGTGTKKRK